MAGQARPDLPTCSSPATLRCAALRCAALRCAADVENWSLDLMSGLPNLTPELWQRSLDAALDAAPQHLSIYDLQAGIRSPIVTDPSGYRRDSHVYSCPCLALLL